MVCTSVTKLVSHVINLERRALHSSTNEIVAKRMEQKVYELDKDFREYHYSILDLMEEGDNFDGEQVILDALEEKISNILDRLYVLLVPIKPTKGVVDDPRHHMNRL